MLSTAYLLVQPNRVIGADEPALRLMNPVERAAWAEAIAQQLRQRVARSAEPITFIVYASQQYAESLMRAAPDLTFESPLTGKTFVERLHWYDDRLRIRPRMLAAGVQS